MQKLIIVGGKKLNGSINISGSKNATLPILAASILSKNKVIIQNIPLVKDVETMIDLLSLLGSKFKLVKKRKKIEILNANELNTFVSYNSIDSWNISSIFHNVPVAIYLIDNFFALSLKGNSPNSSISLMPATLIRPAVLQSDINSALMP